MLHLGTWNCLGMAQGFGAITARSAPVARRFHDQSVLAQCTSPHVLCVQEIFSRDAQRFFDRLGQSGLSNAFRDDNRMRWRPITVRGSGLGIGSRAPLRQTRLHSFPRPHVGWDKLARKGALYTQVELDGDALLDLVTVHLQAGYHGAAIAVRTAQLAHLRALIDEVGAPERPFVVCGDFNIDGLAAARDSVEYRGLLAALPGFEDLGARDDFATFDPSPEANCLARVIEPSGRPQRIDYIFFRPAARAGIDLRCASIGLFLDSPLEGTPPPPKTDRAFASDHYGLVASFAW
jgi:endonuclease/exonuclease/phosphatase family metal-dependent hydrolase